MRVLMQDRHIPHAYMVMTALPEVQFVTTGWNGDYREVPPNCAIMVPPSCYDYDYDAVLDDHEDLPTFKANTKRRIWLQHNEYGGQGPLPEILEKCDRMVVVSDHKRATMRAMAHSKKLRVIGFGFDPKQWEVPKVERSGAGTAFNGMNMAERHEVVEFTAKIDAQVPLRIIGRNNGDAPFKDKVEPYGFEEYKRELNKLAVWVFTVYGEAMGMAPYEAMMMGIPVVTASQPEAWSFCFSNYNCVITRDPPWHALDFIVTTIKELLIDPGRAQFIGEGGRRTVTERFPLSEVGDQYRKLFFE